MVSSRRSILISLASIGAPCLIRGAQLRPATISYPNGGFNWLLFIAKEGGYYEKYGLNSKLVFGGHPAGLAMLVSGDAKILNYSLDQILQAAAKESALTLIASPINRGMFALMASREIDSIKSLRGKRIGIGQLGDANYGYSVSLLTKSGLSPREVEWISLGPNIIARGAALISGRVDAVLLTAPAYFALEGPRVRILVDFAERNDIFAGAALVMMKASIAADPELPCDLIRAHAEAVRRFHQDKDFAVKTYMRYDRNASYGDVVRMHTLYAKPHAFERVPYVLAAAIGSTIDQQTDPQILQQMKSHDFRQVVDNSFVDRVLEQRFFEKIFGDGIRAEAAEKARLAFR